jgi:hypothetical protein
MSRPPNSPSSDDAARPPVPRRRPGRRGTVIAAGVAVAALAALAAAGATDRASAHTSPSTPRPSAASGGHAGHGGHTMADGDRAAAMLATAGFQDVATAEAAGYGSSIDTLGCFQNPERGGMGLHFIEPTLLDDHVDITAPEALVYELDASGAVTGLVAHEYIVPIDAWTSTTPPRLFGMDFHRHPTLPLWVLHAWLWKANPAGVFEDWNPAVRLCPPGVPVFGVDLPTPAS